MSALRSSPAASSSASATRDPDAGAHHDLVAEDDAPPRAATAAAAGTARRARPRRRRPRRGRRTRHRRAGPPSPRPARRPTSRAETTLSSSSPSACPNRSLTPLKPSRSRKSTAMAAVAAPGAQDGLLHPVEEQRPVGQGGQRVVAGQVAHLLGEGEPAERLLGHRGERLEGLLVGLDRGARPVDGGSDQPPGAVAGADPGTDLLGRGAVAPQVGAAGRDDRPDAAPEQLLERLPGVDHLRLGGRAEERLEPPAVLAAPGERTGRDQDRHEGDGEQDAGPRVEGAVDQGGEVAEAVDRHEDAEGEQGAAVPELGRAPAPRSPGRSRRPTRRSRRRRRRRSPGRRRPARAGWWSRGG